MTKLHMDVDTCKSVQSGVTNIQGQLNDIIIYLMGLVDDMEAGLWIGNSATEFYSLFEQWQKNTFGMLDDLGSVASRLGNEIDAWVEAARKLE
jgi:uncharacterized protein YukE